MKGKKCSVEGCDRNAAAKSFCHKHYYRWRQHGDPRVSRPSQQLEHYQNVVLAHHEHRCLFWPFGKTKSGYAVLHVGGKKRRVARLVCIEEHGPPPTPAHEAAHRCGLGQMGCVARKCVRWATGKENVADRYRHGTILYGTDNVAAKLTENDVREIRRLRGRVRQIDLASRFGVTQPIVSAIQLRKIWAWLD